MELSAASAIALFLPLLLHLLLFRKGIRLLLSCGMTRLNYLNQKIPTASGLLLLLYNSATWAVLLVFPEISEQRPVDGALFRQEVLLLTGSFAMAIWGWQDDCSGEKEIKGFRGHIMTLMKEKRMTSGLLKAWGGGSTALIVSLAVSHGLAEILVNTGVLALSANVINLFDLRPARAIKVFWLFLAAVMAMGAFLFASSFWFWFLPAISSTILLFRHDAGGKLMLGDTGSNYLGFIAGFSVVSMLPLSLTFIVLLCLVCLQGLAEYFSFSRVIQAVPWLERLDRWGRQM